jgi:hypothetical protein
MSVDRTLATKWLARLAIALCILVVVLLAGQLIAQDGGWRRDYTTKFLLLPLWWMSGAMVPLGIAGFMLTRRLQWLWLVPAAAIAMTISFLAALSNFNWGM